MAFVFNQWKQCFFCNREFMINGSETWEEFVKAVSLKPDTYLANGPVLL
jgi:hypothetical protein